MAVSYTHLDVYKRQALRDFHVAHPGDSWASINAALAQGKNLLFTPGLYDISRSIRISRPGTVVPGMGHATLTAVGGATPLVVADRAGIVVAGLTVDAGTTESAALLTVGSSRAPVSYTHLDVYKRQVAGWPATTKPGAARGWPR